MHFRDFCLAATLAALSFGALAAEGVPQQPAEQAAARALSERRQQMVHDCVEGHGSEKDCKYEVDVELRAEDSPRGGRR